MALYVNQNIDENVALAPGDVVKYEFGTAGISYSVCLPPGKYICECFGAQGGLYYYDSGKGGYAKGTLNIAYAPLTLFAYPGQFPGSLLSARGGWNGGGDGANRYDARSGGGASDIRLTSGAWNNIDSLRSRIMVAGGGGGEALLNTNGNAYIGGGGLSGADGSFLSGAGGVITGKGGTQTA